MKARHDVKKAHPEEAAFIDHVADAMEACEQTPQARADAGTKALAECLFQSVGAPIEVQRRGFRAIVSNAQVLEHWVDHGVTK